MKLLFVLLSTVLLMAQDTVPKGMESNYDPDYPINKSVNIDPYKLKPGQTACAAGVFMSQERHVWALSGLFYYNLKYGCVSYVTRVRSGWEILIPKWAVPLKYDNDHYYKTDGGYVRMTKVTFYDD